MIRLPAAPHALSSDEVLAQLQTSRHGLSADEVGARLADFGRNVLPRQAPPGFLIILLRQLRDPVIYILLVAALVSGLLRDWTDTGFILVVVIINSLIGAFQESAAQRTADSLQKMVRTRSRVERAGESYELDSEELVPGDVVMLEGGSRVPADVRLLFSHGLTVDESLLTGESQTVSKSAEAVVPVQTTLAERCNMCFSGTMIGRGRGLAVVVGTAGNTEVGRIARAIARPRPVKPPLLRRMERFTSWIAVLVVGAIVLMSAIAIARGTPLAEIFLSAVALAVSAIPEGLPVALTVALAISMRRMAGRNVIVRRLSAVETLGSCTFIASDKTGTLTVNQLTIRRIALPGESPWEVTGEGLAPEGRILPLGAQADAGDAFWYQDRLVAVCRAAVLANEAFLGRRDDTWVHHGDAVDVALLVMAHKAGIDRAETLTECPELATIPFEAERLFAASLNQTNAGPRVFVKGALETVLAMCTSVAAADGPAPLVPNAIIDQAHALAREGYRIIALATGGMQTIDAEDFSESHLANLQLLGLVGMIDPLRSEARDAIADCRKAGIDVAMVTGDHPETALAIARNLDLARTREEVVTGRELQEAVQAGGPAANAIVARARVYARVEPEQKLQIVRALEKRGHIVAVTGDGVNDAPALRTAHVGVAMGFSGTDVARESADLIVTDDNFASIVAGVEEGRIAYANIRKVVLLLVSTGVAEIILFALSLATGLPLPLLPAQLLWLNLVTNGLQDVALAFEPGEGDELARRPRPPSEGVFNRAMIERVLLSATVMAVVAFLIFETHLNAGGNLDSARNTTLLLMVLFENLHVFNCRSETHSLFAGSPLRNPFLFWATLAAQLVHIAAMYTPGLNSVLAIQPVSLEHWLLLLACAVSLPAVMEIYKLAVRVAARRRAH